MATEVKLPVLGEGLEGGDGTDVKISAGDEVNENQTLLELEAEKSTVEVPSPMAGRVTEVRVKKGDKIKTGQVICLMDAKGAGAKEAPKPAAPPAEKKAEKPPEKAPERKPE